MTASGGVTASGATLTGGDDANSPSTGTVTVTSAVGTKTVTIDGIPVVYIPVAGETTATVAGLIYAAVNSHSILNQYVSASWTPGTAVVTLTSKLGFLIVSATINPHTGPIASPTVAPTGVASSGGNLAPGNWKLAYSIETAEGETLVSPSVTIAVTANQKITTGTVVMPPTGTGVNWYLSRLVNSSTLKYILSNDGSAHVITHAPNQTAPFVPARNSTAEEVIRIARSYSNRANVQADCVRGNMLEKSFKWPLGSRQKSVNKIVLKYREASDDFRLTELRVKDSRHIAKVGKELPLEINGTAIDNFHQAVRIANGALAENRDADFFVTVASDGESLLDDIGDVICVTELDNEGVGFINLLVRIEDKRISESTHARVDFTARKYASSLYDDDVYERNIPLPTAMTPKRIDGILEVDDVGGTKTLTDEEARNKIIEIPSTVTLTSDLYIEVPDHSAGYVVRNFSAGIYGVYLKTVSGNYAEATKAATSILLINSSLDAEKVSDSKNQENIIEQVNGVAPIIVSPAGSKMLDISLGNLAGTIMLPTAAQVGLTIKGAASQTASLLDFRDSSNNELSFFNAKGSLKIWGQGGEFPLEVFTSDGVTSLFKIENTNGNTTFAGLIQTGVGIRATAFGTYMGVLSSNRFIFNNGYIEIRNSSDVETARFDNADLKLVNKLVLGGDVNLYRSAANVLKTDDKLIVDVDLEINNGALVWTADGNGDIGASASQRPAVVHVLNNVRVAGNQVLQGRGAALTAANAGAINSGDGTTDAVIGNMRTRINELEARLGSATGHGLFT